MKTIDAAIEYVKQGFSVIPANPRTKAPLIPWTEFQARVPNEDEVFSWFKQYPQAMLGLVTGVISGITVIDADSDEAISKIEDALPDSMEVPCVQTPRDGGHFYFSYNPFILTRAGVIDKIDTRCDGGFVICPPSINAQGRQYRWLDGCELSKENLQPMPDSLVEILSQRPKQVCATREHYKINNTYSTYYNKLSIGTDDNLTTYFADGRRDSDLFTIANGLIKSGVDTALASEVLRRLILSWGEDVDEKWVNAKIESALKRSERREKSLSDDVREWVLSSNGVFLSSDVVRNLQVSSRDERKNLSKILSRLCDEGVIERYGNKNGCYRRIENHIEIIDFQNFSIDATLNIKLPFQIENYVKIMPKNIIVLAGEPNSGKTAFLLNVVKENMQNQEIYYFSSEMGGLELQDRLSKFDIPLGQWKCKFIERSSNFADVIKPDALNIIDFLEINDEFYKVAGFIKEIFDKLKKGVAIIALQKNRGTDYGLGRMRSLEKPRLYLAMETGKIKIVKGKNWANSEKNPNGMICDFKLVNGCKFIMTSGWKVQD